MTPVEYAIEFGGEGPQDVTITTSGPATVEGLTRYVKDLVEDARFRPGMFILADHRELEASTVSASEVKRQAEMMKLLDDRFGNSKVAIVVASTLSFGYARMYELHAAETQLHSRVFYSRGDGLAWLDAERSMEATRSA
jgi:hypothetical protein